MSEQCAWCGITFLGGKWVLKYQYEGGELWFCDQSCAGEWFASSECSSEMIVEEE